MLLPTRSLPTPPPSLSLLLFLPRSTDGYEPAAQVALQERCPQSCGLCCECGGAQWRTLPPRPVLVVGELIEDRTVTFGASLGCATNSIEIQTTATFIVGTPVRVLAPTPPGVPVNLPGGAVVVLPTRGAGDGAIDRGKNGGERSAYESEFERYMTIVAAGYP